MNLVYSVLQIHLFCRCTQAGLWRRCM